MAFRCCDQFLRAAERSSTLSSPAYSRFASRCRLPFRTVVSSYCGDQAERMLQLVTCLTLEQRFVVHDGQVPQHTVEDHRTHVSRGRSIMIPASVPAAAFHDWCLTERVTVSSTMTMSIHARAN